MKKTDLGDVPNSWGNSELTRFIDHARKNQIATFLTLADQFRPLEAVDEALQQFASNTSNIGGQYLAPIFVLRCHSAFRAASELALAGHVAEAFVMTRSLLEYAGYGLLIAKDPALETLWVSRHQQQGGEKAVSKAFNPTAIRTVLRTLSADDANHFDQFYQRSIDFGAHPNIHALNSSLTVTERANEIVFFSKYLHDGDQAHRHAMRSVSQSGICALLIFRHAFPDRFRDLALGSRVASIIHKWPL